ncbi:MAG: hypothetical protein IPM76_09225 [Chloroflexi bacterium]|nr:hypothetical protein [Chloroflexota bacterium]
MHEIVGNMHTHALFRWRRSGAEIAEDACIAAGLDFCHYPPTIMSG